MHRYLKASGFDNIRTRNDLKSILMDVQNGFNHQTIVSYRPGEDFCEVRKDYGQCMGISLCGEMDENVLAAVVIGDKAIALFGVEPFYSTGVHAANLLFPRLIKKSHVFVNHPRSHDLQKHVSSFEAL